MNEERQEQAMREAARIWLRERSWQRAGGASGISPDTLRFWNRQSTATPLAEKWRQILGEVEKELAGEAPPAARVTTSGFKSPEQLCDHWSLEAARVQVETMTDPDAPRRDRLDASKHVLALGGHSPINKSVVIAAPISDPRLTASIIEAIRGTQVADQQATLLLPLYTQDAAEPAAPQEN